MLILVIDVWGIACEIAHRWMSQQFIDDKHIYVAIWCHQATIV